MSTSNPRPILPKVDEAANSNPEITTTVTPRKHVVLACTACKKRKTKCDGQGPPCSMCSRKSTTCEYVEAQARMDQLKRDNADLAGKNDQYAALLAFLRNGTTEESSDILHRLRQGPSVEELLESIEHGNLLLRPIVQNTVSQQNRSPQTNRFPFPSTSQPTYASPTETTNHVSYRSNSVKRKLDATMENDAAPPHLPCRDTGSRSTGSTSNNSSRQSRDHTLDRLSVSFLTSGGSVRHGQDDRTYPSNWTNVTDDDHRVSDLISLWFSCYHPSFRFIDKELFFEAFAEGPACRGSGFCSPLLVNCICASACHISERIRGKSTPWHDDFIGKKFLQEAQALWSEEEGRESLVNLQSATILCDIVSHNGKDKKGISFLLTACQLARSQGLLRDPSSWETEQQENKRAAQMWRRARAAAAWGLFHYQSTVCYSLKRFPLMRRAPVVEIPEVDEDGDLTKVLFRAECQLAVILNELGTMRFSDDDGYAGFTAPVEKTEEMYQRLLLLQNQLPRRITGEPDGDPSTLLLQIQIQYVIVSLFSPYADPDRLDLGQKFYTTRSITESRAALAALRQLLNLWSYCFGFSRCPYYLSHILLFDGLTALDELKTAQSTGEGSAAPDAYTGLMSSIIALGEMSQRFVVCEAKLKALKVKSAEIGVHLSLRARQALEVVDQPGWTSKATAHFRSSIPMFLASASVSTPDSVRLDNMLKTWTLTDEENERPSRTSSLSDGVAADVRAMDMRGADIRGTDMR